VVSQARPLDLTGWVRNRRDGSVEILAAGHPAGLAMLEAACLAGPPAARVADVSASETDEAVPAGFEQRPTA
jgi:acylphosphatase